ncbi:hypothetical protein L7F22_055931 [Adiantum nelumboides]|nr:hypothetical protein [Adiantum nelumboides]
MALFVEQIMPIILTFFNGSNGCALLLPSLLLACLLLPTILSFKAKRGRQLIRLPPGPPGLPILGHLHLLGSATHRSLADLSRRHGPLIYLRFGSIPVVVASSPAIAKLILQTHDHIFAWRPQPTVVKHLFGFKDVLFSQPDPYWKLMRQLYATDLFGPKRLRAFGPMIAEEVRAMLSTIADSGPHKLVPVRATLYCANTNIIARMAIGKRLHELAPQISLADPSHNLALLIGEVFQLLGVLNIGDYIPWLAFLDLQGYGRQSKALSLKLQRLWQEVIDARRSLRRQTNSTAPRELDFLDVLLSAAESNVEISDFNIKAILCDIFGAGIETSASSTEWALSELLTHPFIMKRLQEELESVVGGSRLVCESDVQQMPYLRAVVKETMRLHPVSPILAPHMASQQCQLLDFDIPKNTHVYVNAWAIGRDPTIWDRPLEFRPERFLDSDVDVRGQHFHLLPFGSGRRRCPALSLGFSNVHIMLANLIQVFDWSTENLPNLSEKFRLAMALEDPLVARASLKVSKHLLKEHV